MKNNDAIGPTMALAAALLFLTVLTLYGRKNSRDHATMRYSVQLIQAAKGEKLRGQSLKPVGEALKAHLSGIFHWDQYGEVNRHQVRVQDGEVAKLRLSSACEVEIECVSPTIRETRVYINGVLSSRSRSQVQPNARNISGGTKEDGGAWFLVVEDQGEEEPPERNARVALQLD